ncbi:hypothetical protein HDU97_002281 [Phlyctochytrium planicorne]|nr:hypothetical protein HDU97_002281 [Phlyctochytrium planicorne]
MPPQGKKAKPAPQKPATVTIGVSPYAVFRSAESSSLSVVGCPHLADVKFDNSGAGMEFSKQGKELMTNFRESVRHSLGYGSRSQLNVPKKALAAKKGEDEDDANSKKRKKQTGLEVEIQGIEQLWSWVITHFIVTDAKIMFMTRTLIGLFIQRDPGIKRIKCSEWMPSTEEGAKIKMFSTPAKKCSGLRGLRNMGSTTFIHNPLLRTHFMSDKHNPEFCRMKMAKQVCLACELDNLYAQFYNGTNTPFGPTSFLFSMWKSNAALASYAQQDAHEFFMSVLNLVHGSCSVAPSSDGNQSDPSCKCIIHSVFAGVLQSDVTCQKCHNITTTYDPIFDLSLNIRHSKGSKSSKTSSKKKSGAAGASPVVEAAQTPDSKGDANKLKVKEDSCTLLDCLERNFAAEKLTVYQCGNPECAKSEPQPPPPPSTPGASKEYDSIKHVTVKSLPPVLSIQLKRFEHSGQGSKIETFVKIPTELDMTPYTTKSVKARTKKSKKEVLSSKKHSTKWLLPFDAQIDSVPDYQYSLFAVINHQGKLETGHYTAYVKCRGEWFYFDDHNVQLASQKDVLNSKV